MRPGRPVGGCPGRSGVRRVPWLESEQTGYATAMTATIATASKASTFPRVKVVAHSVYPGGPEVISVQATGRRFILAELNTHRVLSKNSASSRAIPFPKQVQKIIDDLAYPEVWASEKKGMQGGEEIEHIEDWTTWVGDEEVTRPGANSLWLKASENALEVAQELAKLGVHKSLVNRLLEPFMWHTVVLTGTAWENFFSQRCSPLAQPEIRVMAEEIRTAIQNSTPRELDLGEWHLPYIDDETRGAVMAAGEHSAQRWLARISAARCARVSYLTQEGKRDLDEDLLLYERLTTAQPPHWSPLEHVATPWPENRGSGQLEFVVDGVPKSIDLSTRPLTGNLLGWRSLRTEVEALREVETYR